MKIKNNNNKVDIFYKNELNELNIMKNNILNEKSILIKKLSSVDLLVNDIEHEIELQNISGKDMLLKYKELKKVLQTRRYVKDRITAIDAFLKSFKSINHNIRQRINSENERGYELRIKRYVRQSILNDDFNLYEEEM